MILIIVGIILMFLVAVLALQNSMTVTINFIAWNFETSLVLVILGSAALGFLVALCWALYGKAKNYLAGRKIKEQIKALENEKLALQERLRQLEPASPLVAQNNSPVSENDEEGKNGDEDKSGGKRLI